MNQDDEPAPATSEIPHVVGMGTIPNRLEWTGGSVGKVAKSVSIAADSASVNGGYAYLRDHRLCSPGFPVFDIRDVNLDYRCLHRSEGVGQCSRCVGQCSGVDDYPVIFGLLDGVDEGAFVVGLQGFGLDAERCSPPGDRMF